MLRGLRRTFARSIENAGLHGSGQAALEKGVLLLLAFLATSYVLNLESALSWGTNSPTSERQRPWQYLYSFGKIFQSTDSFFR
jgi:hypothetical protein